MKNGTATVNRSELIEIIAKDLNKDPKGKNNG